MIEQGCNNCYEICEEIDIELPEDLIEVIIMIKKHLAAGTIVENMSMSHFTGEIIKPFEEVPEEGPWNDVLEYYFECTECKQCFKLFVETYHGYGGEWKPVDENDI